MRILPSARHATIQGVTRCTAFRSIVRVMVVLLLAQSVPLDGMTSRSAHAGEPLLWVGGAGGCGGRTPCFATVQAAIDAVGPGETVRILPGEYVEQLVVRQKNAGATDEASRITIEADPAAPTGSVVLRGARNRCEGGYSIDFDRSRFVTLRGLVVSGAGQRGVVLRGGARENAGIHLERNRIFRGATRECSGGIDVGRGNPGTLIANNLVYASGRDGIRFRDARGGTSFVVGNTIVRNGWSGVSIARGTSVRIYNNVIAFNGTAPGRNGGRNGIRRARKTPPAPEAVELGSNLVCGNRLGELEGALLDALDAGNQTPTGSEGAGVDASPTCASPAALFARAAGPDGVADTADDDFALASGSPALDRGLDPRGRVGAADAIVEADFRAPGARPSDGDGDDLAEFDVGAIEGTGAPQPTPTVTTTASPTPTVTTTASPTPTVTTTASPTPTQQSTPAPTPSPSPTIIVTTPTPSPASTPTRTPAPTGNGAPVAVDDEYALRQGETLTVPATGVLANDRDPDGNALTATLVDPPALGTLSAFHPDGSFTYEPPAAFVQPALNPGVLWRIVTGTSGFGQVADFDRDGFPDLAFVEFGQVYGHDGRDGSRIFQVDFSDTSHVDLTGCSIGGAATSSMAVGDVDDSGNVAIVKPLACGAGFQNQFVAINASQISGGRVGPLWASDNLSIPHPGAYASASDPAPANPPIRTQVSATERTHPSLARLTPSGGVKVLARKLLRSIDGIYLGLLPNGTIAGRQAGCRSVTGLPADEGQACRITWIIDAATGAVENVLTTPNPTNDFNLPVDRPLSNNPPLTADLDGDGDVEIVSGSDVFTQVGGVWTLAWQTHFEPMSVAVADLDGDGTQEVIQYQPNLFGRLAAESGIFVYRHDGTLLRRIPPVDDSGLLVGFLSIGDVDGDGAPDILFPSAGHLYAFRGDGRLLWIFAIPDRPETLNGLVPPPVSWPFRTGETSAQVYDLDLDGHPEVIMHAGARLWILDGATGGETWSMDTEGYGAGSRTLALADMDQDGHVDIVATGSQRWNCSVITGGPVPCLGNTLVVSGIDHDWAPGPRVFNQITFNPDQVDDAARVLFSSAPRRDYRMPLQQGTVVDPRLRGGTTFTYAASDGALSSAPATVFVEINPENSPPTITSLPPTALLSTTPYTRPTYQITASDPDPGDVIRYELVSSTHPFGTGPGAGVNVNPDTGLVDFYVGPCGSFGGPCVFNNDILVVVAAIDSLGARDEQTLLLTISPYRVVVPDVVGLLLQPAIDALLAASLRAQVLLEIFDPAPAGTVLAQNPVAGTPDVPVNRTVELTVSKGPEPTPTPTPTATPDPNATPTPVPTAGPPLASIVVEPANPIVLTGDTQAFRATGVFDDGTSADLTSQVTWQSSATASATIAAAGVATALAAGSSTISATIDGVTGTTGLTVVAAVAGDTTAPVAEITAPASNAEVTEPTDVVGTASDDNLLSWELAISPAGAESFRVVRSAATSVVAGVLGVLDPTLLLNEPLDVRLTVRDRGGNESTARVTVQVTRQRKVGAFTLTFQDLNVALAGLPITISRTYDSRDKSRGDFGVGWRLNLQTLRLRPNRVLGTGWTTQTSGISVQLVALDQHTVTVTLPDGKTEIFDLHLSPTANIGSLDFTNVAGFVPRPETLGTLESLDNGGLLVVPGGAEVELWDDSSLTTYDPKLFRYTDRVGNRFVVDRDAGVQSIEDRNGNTLTFGPSGITHSSGRSVAIVRDAQGRVTAINDPSGGVQTYQYDANGDLRFHTDPDGRVTELEYDRHHGLLEVITPDGQRGVRNEYDADGRLVASIDGAGHRVEYARTPGVLQEIVRDRLGNQSVIEYDAVGNVTAKTDPLGARTEYTFDARGNQLTEKDPVGRTASKAYDAADRVLSATDFDGNTTTYVYGAGGRLASTTDPEGNVATYAYDASGRVASITAPDGGVTTNAYDAAGNLVAVTDALGRTTTSTYDAFGNRTTQTDPLGAMTTFGHDALGRRTSEQRLRTLPGGGTQVVGRSYQYDGFGHVVRSVDALGNPTDTTYDGAGRIASIVAADGQTTTYAYDDAGNLVLATYPDGSSESWTHDAERRGTTSTDRDGRTTSYAFDAVGRLIRTTHPDGAVERIDYDAAGRITAKTDARGNVTTYAFAPSSQTVTDALGNVTVHLFDSQGRTVATTDANGNTTTWAYDHRGNRTVTTFPDGTTSTDTFDLAGNRLSTTDQAGRTTTFAWNARNQLVAVTDASGAVTTYAYDEIGNRVAETAPTGATTRYEHDALGRILSRVRPMGERDAAVYDAMSNVLSFTDMNGATTTNVYDAAGSPTARHLPDGSTVQVAFSPAGLRLQLGGDTWAHDARGRMVTESRADGETLSFAWDAGGNRTTVTSSAGTTSYVHDALDRLVSVSDATGVTAYTYDAVGNLATITLPNGVVTAHTYDALNRLVSIASRDGGGALLARYDYTLGPAGNRARVVESGSATTGRAVDYAYDAVYRLVRETIDEPGAALDREITYAYDAAGNRLSRLDEQGAVTAETVYSYDANDRLLTETSTVTTNGSPSGSGTLTYAWDANGNMLSRSNGTETDAYTFDSRNRLVRADLEVGGASSVEYGYDEDGLRTSSSSGGVTTTYVTDKSFEHAQVLLEKTGPSTVAYTLGHARLARRVDASPARFFLADGQASTRQLVSATGVVTDAWTYDAFGRLLASSGSSGNEFLYAGEQLDPNVGFYYLRARWYDQSTGRFASPDPKPGSIHDPPSLHRYLYVRSSPVDHRDPSGLENTMSLSVAAAIAGTLATISGIATYAYTNDGGLAIAVSAGVFAASFVAVYGIAATAAWAENILYQWATVIAPGAYITQQYLARAGNAILAQGQAIIYQANQVLLQQYGNAVQGISNVNQFLLRPETAGWIRHINQLLGSPHGRRVVCAAISAARAFSQIEGGPSVGGPGPYDRAQAAMIASAMIFMANARGLVCGDGPP